MNSVRFNPAAEVEMIDAVAWYESQQVDLGKRFLTSVEDAINRIEMYILSLKEICIVA